MRFDSLVISFLLIVCSWTFACAEGHDLRTALKSTLTHHPQIKEKLADLKAQGFIVDAAKSARYPSLTGQLSTADDGDNGASITIRQPLWAFGKIDAPIMQSKAQYEAQRMSFLLTQRELIQETAEAYTDALGYQAKLNVANDNIEDHQQLYDQILRRREGLLASETDVKLAMSRLIQVRAQAATFAGDLDNALHRLANLTQKKWDRVVVISEGETLFPAADVVREAVEAHASIRYKLKAFKVVQSNIAVEKTQAMPTLFAKADQYFYDGSSDDELIFSFVLEGTLEGAGLTVFNRVKSASMKVEAAKQDLHSTRNNVLLELDQLLSQKNVNNSLISSQIAAVDSVRETLESFQRQYETGRKSWLEVLNMYRELTQQEISLTQAQNDGLMISLKLSSQFGFLDKEAGIEASADH